MKKLFVIIMIVMISIPAFSQLNFGIKAGAATTTVPSYDLTSGTNNIEALKDAAWGFHAGAFLRLSLFGIYLQPEVVFASNTYDYNVSTLTSTQVKSQKFNRLEIPVLLGVKFGPFRINAGPSATVQIGTPKALVDDPDFENMYRNATFGYQAGIGLDILKKLTLDARYGGSLSKKFGDAVNIGNQTFSLDQRQPSLILSVGLMF
ncbi:MAG: PorT family protein [Bacteroidales bacterium]|nr:PorT family protein [Bacteroidales bacterium]